MAKLAHAAGLPGKHTNHSLRATAATRLYDQNIDEHQISKLTGHCSVAVCNYQRVSIDKEKELSDVLYGKCHKKEPTHTVTSAEQSNFDVGSLSQITTKMEDKTKILVNVPDMDVKVPVLKFPDRPIVVQPMVNLNAKDLQWNEKGQVVLPEIMVKLVININ